MRTWHWTPRGMGESWAFETTPNSDSRIKYVLESEALAVFTMVQRRLRVRGWGDAVIDRFMEEVVEDIRIARRISEQAANKNTPPTEG